MKFYGRSPVRISLCNGGDTDYYIKEMGWTNLINATLNSGFYACLVERKKQNFIDYSYANGFLKNGNFRRIYDLNEEEQDLKLITETIKEVNPDFRGNINIFTNVPEKSGLGGSTSLIVSLIKSLIKTTKIENMTPEKIAWLAYKIERINLGMKGGYQDQWAAAFSGGVNYLEFRKNKVFIEPLWLSESLMRRLEDNLLLFFIEPRKGDSGNVHEKLEARMKQKSKKDDILMMLKRRENVLLTREALLKGDLKKFAELLNTEQKSKEILMKDLLTQKTKKIYDAALSNGAIAGKISGAGSGGCAFFVYDKKDKNKFIKKMNEFGCINLPLKLQRLDSMGEI
jgi:D-glycero-alpha-D-manno-heptose-7-phosphate kinase